MSSFELWDCEENGHVFSDSREMCIFCNAKYENEATLEDFTIEEKDSEEPVI